MTSSQQDPWRAAVLGVTASVRDAIDNLNETGLRIVLVIAADGTLAGTVTDGDVRRGLLRGVELDRPLDSVMNRRPLIAPPQLSGDTLLQLMQANAIHQVPIVDEARRVVGLHLLDDFLAPTHRDNVVVLMAGGFGRRLRPYTENKPKPMVEVAGRPMLEHLIMRVRNAGFTRFVIAIHYLGHLIQDYFGDGHRWQVEISYLCEEAPLGTAGALGLLDPVPALPFLVSNGDVITDIRYDEFLKFHERHGAAATMAVRQHEWEHPFGVVHTKGPDIVGFEEKPITRSHINAGVYVIDPAALGALEKGEPCDMPTLFERLQRSGHRTVAYPMHEPWLDVGRPDDLRRAQTINRPEE